MNRLTKQLKSLAWMLATGLTAAAVLTGCNNSSSYNGGSATPALALLAGSLGGDGSVDATGNAASFYRPSAVTIDGAGNMYVADTRNCTIRKVTPAGVVTTLAGTAGVCGNVDGTGAAAQFDRPHGLATDGTNLYVADKNNNTIRKLVIATGVVTTLAGTGNSGSTDDPVGTNASFNNPKGVALNHAGTLLYVADRDNCTIRQINVTTTAVTTLAGTAGTCGYLDDPSNPLNAQFNLLNGLATDSSDNIYVSERGNHVIRQIAPSGAVTTLAGSQFSKGISGPGPNATDGAPGTANFRFPSGMATDGSGNLYVADKVNGLLRKVVIATGVVSTVAGTASSSSSYDNAGGVDGTGTAASFNHIGGIAIATDSAGNVYVPDTMNFNIRKITAAGVVTTIAGTAAVGTSNTTGSTDGTGAAATFYHPWGVATDSAGNSYVSDAWDYTIRKITAAGVVTTFAGTAGSSGNADGTGAAASFSEPLGLAIDSAGNVYVADKNNNSIRKITPAGVVTTLVTTGLGLSSPHGLTIDSAGNLYEADQGTNTIQKITPAAVVSTFATGFNKPVGLAIDSAGNVYEADANTYSINKISPAGVVSLLAGSGTQGSSDGTGVAASFIWPQGLAVDSTGNVYVADGARKSIGSSNISGSGTVRKITPSGVVTTVVGVAGKKGFTTGALPGYLAGVRSAAIHGNTLYIIARHGVAKVTPLP